MNTIYRGAKRLNMMPQHAGLPMTPGESPVEHVRTDTAEGQVRHSSINGKDGSVSTGVHVGSAEAATMRV
jgi:hypothetical protein